MQFYRKLNQRSYYTLENSIQSVLVYSQIIPDYGLFGIFLDNNFIFLNHVLLKYKHIYVYKNDFIQLQVTL